MSNARGPLFPFDGECNLSKGADLTITFSDGDPLKAHSQHLKQASSVLKTALEDCKHDGTLDVGDDSREAWIMLLNLVHPGRRVSCLNSSRADLSRMVGSTDANCISQPIWLVGTLRLFGSEV